jgi:hypothetical protein
MESIATVNRLSEVKILAITNRIDKLPAGIGLKESLMIIAVVFSGVDCSGFGRGTPKLWKCPARQYLLEAPYRPYTIKQYRKLNLKCLNRSEHPN